MSNSEFFAHSSTKRLRFLLRTSPTKEQTEYDQDAKQVSFVPMELLGELGAIDTSLVKDKTEVENGYTRFFENDILVAKITPCFENGKGARVGNLHNHVGYGTTELHVLSPLPEVEPRYLLYLTLSHHFRSQGEAEMKGAAGQKRVPEEFILNYKVSLPSLQKQVGVADFLDRETTRIDALIAAKERLLDLLEEKRRALITNAVTKGLDPNAPMRDSGVPWIGKIPKHWEVERAKWLFKERDERTENDEGELLTVSHITGVTPRSEKEVNMFEAETTEGYKACKANDLVINTMWAWMGAMGISRVEGIVSPSYNVYAPLTRLFPEYVDLIVRTPLFKSEVVRHSKGVWSSRLRLYPEGLFEILFPVPTIQEQISIVNYMKSETQKTDSLFKVTQQTISLLKERRASLIAEAVTGKLVLV